KLDPLKLFGDDDAKQRLLQPLFAKFVTTKAIRSMHGESPRVVLRFGLNRVGKAAKLDEKAVLGGPAMIEWRPPLPAKAAGDEERNERRAASGRGRVVLVTTTLNSDWGGWPASQAFPPLMLEVMHHAAAARLRERALLSGEPIELHLRALASGAKATLDAPRDVLEPGRGDADEKRIVDVVPQGDGSVMRFLDTAVSGLYRATVGGEPKEHFFAVNPPAATDDQQGSESDLARLPREELQRTYPDWDIQVVTALAQIDHTRVSAVDSSEVVYAPQGPPIARVLLLLVLGLLLLEVVLAWRFGHYSSAGTLPDEGPKPPPGFKEYALWAAPWVLLALLAAVAGVLLHTVVTGDFLGFMPEAFRSWVEKSAGVPPPAPGEGSRWRLEFSSYFHDGKADPWLAGTLVVLAAIGIGWIYAQEGHKVPPLFRAVLACLRVGVLLLMLGVFLPQLKLFFERQGWPDVVLLIDDSASMSHLDVYRDDKLREAADALAEKADLSEEEKSELAKAGKAGMTRANRLRLAQTLLARDEEWLREALARRKVRLHVYRFASRAQRIADVTVPSDVEAGVAAIRNLRANPDHDSTQVGTAIRQVLNDFRGSSLSAVVVFTDGASTDGEPLDRVDKYAESLNVPLLFVGIGDPEEPRDLYLHDLNAPGSAMVNDTINFNFKVTAQGFQGLTTTVTLTEKGKDKVLASKTITLPPGKKAEQVRLKHRPTEIGTKQYVISVPVQEGETDKRNNRIEKKVNVVASRLIRVLYVEGYRRYEYHYLKSLLERESARVKGNKTIDLRVLLLDADPEFAASDRTALTAFPTPFKKSDEHTDKDDLWSYDVVILGDIDPADERNKVPQGLKDIAEWVEKRNGGLLVLGGERFSPAAYRGTA
ncbi:MAG: VWA domain-containing protein, partial [Gemmataceae bacterium]|nr:VWA domain-containing protein [Gemmataceae bacterium]